MQRRKMFNTFKNDENLDPIKIEKVKHIKEKVESKHKMTLEDLDALKNLYEKMKAEEEV
jgi:hypothetical protein